MTHVYPFNAVQYQSGLGDVSPKVAPPYDVLGAPEKAEMLARDAANVVGFDLPHVPAKQLGPPEAYTGAAELYRGLLEAGTLAQREAPAMFAYRQTFEVAGQTYERCGMACTLETQPLGPRDGGGVLPHEQTFSGPKEDRMALMKATATQLSPIFGLHQDAAGTASAIVRDIAAARPEAMMTADLGDGVKHEIWTVTDEAKIAAYQQALEGEDVFIADGHHRYNTAVNYLRWLEEQGEVPADHPARRTMFVLVSMSDPGLYIGPTHRVLGGMAGYSIEAFCEAAGGQFEIEPCSNDPVALGKKIEDTDPASGTVLGLVDFKTNACFVATPKTPDLLEGKFGDKPAAWRTLDVAVVQHVIVEQICKPKLNGGEDVKWAFPHSIDEVLAIGSGTETGAGGGESFAQLGVIVRPTPLDAVREISNANELMPQKSTFFFPKLATGLFINPLA